jgi:MFS transporter, DHA2 family, multidrug resistance protein
MSVISRPCDDALLPGTQGSNASDAASQAVAWIGQTLQQQIDLLAYIDVFWLLMVVGAIMIPVALILKPVDLGAPAKGH